MTLCGPWVAVENVRYCDPTKIQPDGQLARAILASSDLLYAATGYRWPGICTHTVHPGSGGAAVQFLANPTGEGARPIPTGDWDWWGAGPCTCGIGDPLGSACSMHANVHLPGHPIIEVTSVTIGGQAFTDFDIWHDYWLVRTDGQAWPCCDDDFIIVYTYGSVPGPAGQIAAEVLACELVKSWPPNQCDDCRLPQRLINATYEGANFSVVDPQSLIGGAGFGLSEVDWFVDSVNGTRKRGQTPAKMLSAAEMFGGAHEVR